MITLFLLDIHILCNVSVMIANLALIAIPAFLTHSKEQNHSYPNRQHDDDLYLCVVIPNERHTIALSKKANLYNVLEPPLPLQ